MKPILHPLALLFAALLVCGCATRPPAPSPASAAAPVLRPERGQVWQLVALRGRDVSRSSAPVTLEFTPDAFSLKGHAQCNDYYADCRMRWLRSDPDGDRYSLSVSALVGGKVMCPEPAMNADSRYLALLAKADEMLLSAYTLVLYSRGREVLKFELL